MEPITLGFVAEHTRGALNGDAATGLRAVCTDTRAISPGCLFVALKGDRFDGHNFVAKAFELGAAAALVQCKTDASGPTVQAEDTAQALLDLAAGYRARFELPVVGVTGSVGKTSTKEMICAVLSRRFVTLKNEGNRNNLIGMPLSVFGLEDAHGAAVFEMGMSAFGEIAAMARVARPRVGVITNIGVSHIEKLGSRENILKAKLELVDGLEPGGTVVLNGDDPLLRGAAASLPCRVVTYGIDSAGCDYTAERLEPTADGTRFVIRSAQGEQAASVPAPGRHHVYNALAAFAVGRLLGVEAEQAALGMAEFSLPGQRQRITQWRGATFIEDCYNASPDSMRAAFEVLAQLGGAGRRVAVLGDMLELGEVSDSAHVEVGKLAAESGVDLLCCFGAEARRCCDGFQAAARGRQDSRYFDGKPALAGFLRSELAAGDTVLFKASRGMKLEEVIDALRLPEN